MRGQPQILRGHCAPAPFIGYIIYYSLRGHNIYLRGPGPLLPLPRPGPAVKCSLLFLKPKLGTVVCLHQTRRLRCIMDELLRCICLLASAASGNKAHTHRIHVPRAAECTRPQGYKHSHGQRNHLGTTTVTQYETTITHFLFQMTLLCVIVFLKKQCIYVLLLFYRQQLFDMRFE